MNRRSFLKTSIAATSLAGITSSLTAAVAAAATANSGQRDIYDLRAYTLKPDKQKLMDDYLAQAFIPALGRLGIGPVGVFAETLAPNPPTLHVLIRYTSSDQIAAVVARLADDAEYLKAGADYLRVPATEPVFDRIDSSLLLAFDGMQTLAVPAKTPRLFQLRTYESHSEAAAKKKIEMFNTAELAIFRRVGLTPVFFGETIFGPRMPNLTYMLTFPDDTARKDAWAKFGPDPEWQKLRAMPEYADKNIVSKIWNRFVTPTPYSQI